MSAGREATWFSPWETKTTRSTKRLLMRWPCQGMRRFRWKSTHRTRRIELTVNLIPHECSAVITCRSRMPTDQSRSRFGERVSSLRIRNGCAKTSDQPRRDFEERLVSNRWPRGSASASSHGLSARGARKILSPPSPAADPNLIFTTGSLTAQNAAAASLLRSATFLQHGCNTQSLTRQPGDRKNPGTSGRRWSSFRKFLRAPQHFVVRIGCPIFGAGTSVGASSFLIIQLRHRRQIRPYSTPRSTTRPLAYQ